MHPGYYFVGDNVDMRTTVRHMTLLNQNKDHHMYQICAYVNRVSGNHLQNITPKANFETEPFTTVMPSLSDRERLAEEFAFLVAKVWTKYMPHFKVYEPVLLGYIEHAYLKEMRQKTKRVRNTITWECGVYTICFVILFWKCIQNVHLLKVSKFIVSSKVKKKYALTSSVVKVKYRLVKSLSGSSLLH